MIGRPRALTIASILSLGLAACGDDTKLDERVVTGETPSPAATEVVTVFEPLERSYKLRPDKQTRRDALDLDAFQEEYGRYRDAIVATADPNQGEAVATSAKGEATGLRPRAEMDFAYLDRNGDGRLSLAEYAIWAVPIDPAQPKRSDGRQPYLTADQANRTANSFVFYDGDDDGFLQPGEFAVFTAGKAP